MVHANKQVCKLDFITIVLKSRHKAYLCCTLIFVPGERKLFFARQRGTFWIEFPPLGFEVPIESNLS